MLVEVTMGMLVPFAALSLLVAPVGCASSPPASDGPGSMRPLEPDVALDTAAPTGIDDEATLNAWLAERVAAAASGQRERVRLPVIRQVDKRHCDCPSYAIPAAANREVHWLALVDMTSAGIPPGAWSGWVDGRFTGEVRTYEGVAAGDSGRSAPVFEVMRQRRLGPADVPVVRFVRDVH